MKKILKLLRNVHFLLGVFSFALGIVGIFFPGIPTTPFLLLASFFFSKSSPRFHYYILNHRVFGPPIRDWERCGAIRTRHKCVATLMIATSVIFLALARGIPFWGRASACVLILGALAFIWSRPTA